MYQGQFVFSQLISLVPKYEFDKCVDLLVAYAKKILHLDKTIYEILQILSVSSFDKIPINELLTNKELNKNSETDCKQLTLFDL